MSSKRIPIDDLISIYSGLCVLKIMLRKVGLARAVEVTDENLERLHKLAPELPGLSSLRAADRSVK